MKDFDKMKRFDILEGERFLSNSEVYQTFESIKGRFPNMIEDFIEVVEYYSKQGQKVCCKFSGLLIHSEYLEELKQALKNGNFYDVLRKYSIILGPITSLNEFERSVASLGDFRNPANHKAYIIMMYVFSKMYNDRIKIPMEMNGLDGHFNTSYPYVVFKTLGEILKKYMPSKEIFFDEEGYLKDEFIGEHTDFYTYFGNFCSDYTALAQVGPFLGHCDEAGLHYQSPESFEMILPIIEECKAYDPDQNLN